MIFSMWTPEHLHPSNSSSLWSVCACTGCIVTLSLSQLSFSCVSISNKFVENADNNLCTWIEFKYSFLKTLILKTESCKRKYVFKNVLIFANLKSQREGEGVGQKWEFLRGISIPILLPHVVLRKIKIWRKTPIFLVCLCFPFLTFYLNRQPFQVVFASKNIQSWLCIYLSLDMMDSLMESFTMGQKTEDTKIVLNITVINIFIISKSIIQWKIGWYIQYQIYNINIIILFQSCHDSKFK